ncbi:hypothetical protein Q0601_19170 [Paracoccus onubensis]|uniref:hypothetical protein n=1 Tax=Paracoccus onubensis TaxID=1675788 RepID=UPI002730BB99|nr:hypothetical protein [Paracoccus onubensis]MDP0929311.1 hypothetical protein [Paracoccus onubensis]
MEREAMPHGGEKSGCCGPARQDGPAEGRDMAFLARANAVRPAPAETSEELRAKLRPIRGGFFEMGARRSIFPGDMDSPRCEVKLSPISSRPLRLAMPIMRVSRMRRATGR